MKCMILFLPALLAALILIPDTAAQEKGIWDVVNDSSWRYEDNWTGGVFTFYETYIGKKMAIMQICGSGFLVVGSSLFSVEIEEDELLLYAYTPGDGVGALVDVYYFDPEVATLFPKKGLYLLSVFSSEPWVANRTSTIPIEELKREDYSRLDLLDF
jgi:hypothetical protein